jgi:hypothetical protein
VSRPTERGITSILLQRVGIALSILSNRIEWGTRELFHVPTVELLCCRAQHHRHFDTLRSPSQIPSTKRKRNVSHKLVSFGSRNQDRACCQQEALLYFPDSQHLTRIVYLNNKAKGLGPEVWDLPRRDKSVWRWLGRRSRPFKHIRTQVGIK